MVTYIVPPVALFLGVVFQNEAVDSRLLIGAALIFAGIGIVNMRRFRRAKPESEFVPQQVAEEV